MNLPSKTFLPSPGSILSCWEAWAWWREQERTRGEELQLFRPGQSPWSPSTPTGHTASKSRPLAARIPCWYLWYIRWWGVTPLPIVMTRRAQYSGHWEHWVGAVRSQVEPAAKLAQPSFCTRRDNTTPSCHSQCISFNSKMIYFSKNTILIISKGYFNQYIRALIHPHN